MGIIGDGFAFRLKGGKGNATLYLRGRGGAFDKGHIGAAEDDSRVGWVPPTASISDTWRAMPTPYNSFIMRLG